VSERPEDWDELFLRYLSGDGDAQLERRVREQLLSDESARERLVALACQQQALSDVLTEAAGRKPSSRVLLKNPRVSRPSGPSYGWLFAAAAIVLAMLGFLLFRPGEEPRSSPKSLPAPKIEARAPEKAPPEQPPPKAPLVAEERPKPVPAPQKKEALEPAPLPKSVEKKEEAPMPEAPKVPAPVPKPEPAPRTVAEAVVATVEKVEGDVWILGDGRRSKAEPKQALTSGQGLECAGAAELSYADGTRLKIGPDTLAREFLEPKGRSGKRLKLDRGVLSAEVRKQPADQPMVIETPQGEATVVGTKLRLTVEPDAKGSTRLEVEEGKVRLKRLLDQKTIDVATGHFAVAGSTPTEFKPLPSILLGLVGYWRFEDPAGTTMTDASGQGNDGTLVGKVKRALGKFGQGIELDGATGLVQVPPTAALNPGASTFSLSIWIRNRKQDVWTWNLFFKDDGKFQSYYYFGVGAKPRFEFSTGDAKVTIDGQAGVNDNRWHHLVAVRNATYSAQLYVDGVLDSSASCAPSQNTSIRTTTPLLIGAGNGSFYAGLIDEVRVYSRALSAEEVRQLYSGR
jgi:hypothetical protein